MIRDPLLVTDFYKVDHRKQYPEGTTEIYSNLTARSVKKDKFLDRLFDNKIVFFGLQFFIKDFLINIFNENFFKKPKNLVVKKYKRIMDTSLYPNTISTDHIEALHDLGYLPIKIKALDEGERVPVGVPFFTIKNTKSEFFWLTNYIETILQAYLWKTITTATIAFEFKKLMHEYANITGSDKSIIKFQVHDFSQRGKSSIDDIYLSGAAHLTSFVGTDTIPGIDALEEYYNANIEDQLVGTSVAATEHSVMSAGEKDGEFNTYKRLINEIYPKGILSIVSDTWDLWNVVDKIIRSLKDDIIARDGKVVIRPDSGDPVKIICGDKDAEKDTPQYKGVLNILWEIFGGTVNEKGYRVLDTHIGLIYGDSIGLKNADAILKQMTEMGYASSNIVLGVGSSTYQNITRDTLGFAIKATSAVIKNKRIDLYKEPITDKGDKKSAKGLLRVEKEGDNYKLYDMQNEIDEEKGELNIVFVNGELKRDVTLSQIRKKLEIL